MKLQQKIYVFSLLLFITAFNIGGIILIHKISSDLLKNEINKDLNNQQSISSEIQMDFKMFRIYDNYKNKNDAADFFERYSESFDTKKGYIEVFNISNNKILYSDLKPAFSINRSKLKISSIKNFNYIIQTINKKQYIFINSLMPIENDNLNLYYVKDVSNIYIERKKYYIFFISIEIITCLIFAVFMFFISKLITMPIDNLVKSAKKISEGHYSERININSKDEFAVLSENFNLMAETIENKIKDLEKTNAEKQSFIDNLTHELKTPLTSIIGYANLIRTSKYDEKLFFEASNYIYKEGKRMECMAFKLMNLINLNAENINLKSEKIMNIIDDCKKSLFVKLKDKNIDLIVSGKNYSVNIDKDLIRMLICNLIDNSIKASRSNSKIYISVLKKENKIVIEVKDTGLGIPKKHLERVTEPFYMVDKSRSRKDNGAGLGLSLCKRIVDVHNGTLKIESELNKGTIVKIFLNI